VEVELPGAVLGFMGPGCRWTDFVSCFIAAERKPTLTVRVRQSDFMAWAGIIGEQPFPPP
jgi:hypothetical protein